MELSDVKSPASSQLSLLPVSQLSPVIITDDDDITTDTSMGWIKQDMAGQAMRYFYPFMHRTERTWPCQQAPSSPNPGSDNSCVLRSVSISWISPNIFRSHRKIFCSMPPRVLNNGNWSVLLLALNTLFRNHRTSSGTGATGPGRDVRSQKLSWSHCHWSN